VLLDAVKLGLKLSVVATFVFIVYKSRARKWTEAARNHFNFLMAISFFSLFGHIVYEAYLTFLFVVLAYLVAARESFVRQARVLIYAIFFFSFWQNIIWMDLLRYLFDLNTIPELIGIGLFKSSPLILLLVLLWKHYRELFESYEFESWRIEPPRALGQSA
jgi:hypothetical protein